MKKHGLGLILALFAVGSPHIATAQDVRLRPEIGRQCAIPGTTLYAYLQTSIPECNRFCTVERDEPGEELVTFNAYVFECADEDEGALALDGLGAAAVGLGLLGLLMSSSSSNEPLGAASDTQ